MQKFRNGLRVVLWVTLLSMISFFLVSSVSFSATVQACRKLKQSRHVDDDTAKKADRKVYCSIKPIVGEVGEYVEIKNKSNYIVAVGRIIKQGRSTTIIVLVSSDPEVGSMVGYPAMMRNQDNQYFWTATTAPF